MPSGLREYGFAARSATARTYAGPMPERTDIDVVRAVYDAMHAHDFAALFTLLDPAIVVTQDPRLPWGGRHEGHDGFAQFGLTLGANITSAVTIHAVFAADDEVIQMGHTRGTVNANGYPFDIAEVHRWKIVDGLAVRAHFAIDTPAMLAVLETPGAAGAVADFDQP